jgi:hypothetical protein
LEHPNAWRNRSSERSRGLTHVVLGLKVQPKAGLHVEKQTQTQGGIGRYGAVAIDQIADSTGRNIHVSSQLTRSDAHGLHEIFQQNFAGVNFVK